MVIHLFVSETIVAAAMYTRIKQGGGISNQRVPYKDLFAQASFLSLLFRGEFVFPTEGIVNNLHKTLRGLEADRIIKIGYKDADNNEMDYVGLTEDERQCGRENYDFYCFLIWPFIESAWLAGVAIIGLTPPKGCEEVWVGIKEAQDMAQLVCAPFLSTIPYSVLTDGHRLGKHCTTKATSHTSKPSTKSLSRTRSSASRKKESLPPRNQKPARTHQSSDSHPSGYHDGTQRRERYCMKANCGTTSRALPSRGGRARTAEIRRVWGVEC